MAKTDKSIYNLFTRAGTPSAQRTTAPAPAKSGKNEPQKKKLKNVPEIRFPGFSEPWKVRKLGEILQTLPYKNFIKLPEQDGKYEIIQQGNTPILGYANGVPCNDYEDSVIFGDHTLSLYKPESPFFVATDGVRIIKGKEKIDGLYLMALLENYKPASEGYKRHYSILANCVCFFTTDYEEQQQIGAYFQNLDNLITASQRELEGYQELKQGMLQKMFPKEGKTVPEIRFPKFSGPWEMRKLNEIVKSIDTGKSKFRINAANGEYPILGSTSIIGYDDIYDYDGDFILTARVGANAGSLYRYKGKVKISDNTVFIQADGNIDFVYYLLVKYNIKQLSFGTGQPLIKASDLKNIDLTLPKQKEEQQQITTYFQNLDNLINASRREVEGYKKLKEAMLQKMFP